MRVFIEELSRHPGSDRFELIPVECLSVCKRPVTIGFSAPGKWSYIYGDFSPERSADTILLAAQLYADAPDGLIPWRERPDPDQARRCRAHSAGFRAIARGGGMSALNKVPVTIVTGFLGAGKTTLIRHVLENVRGRRLALIVNEFGDVGVDGEILRSCGAESCPDENIVELANGCLCCTVADDFVPTIEALLAHEKRPDHIVVETSGLALPKPLVKAFDWPDLRARVTVDGVIAVVDGLAVAEGRFADDPQAVQRQRAADESIDHDNPLEEVYEDQLLCADLVVFNKADLLDARAYPRRHRGDCQGRPARQSRCHPEGPDRSRTSCSALPPRPRTILPSALRIMMRRRGTITTISTRSSSMSPRRKMRPALSSG